MVPRNITGNYTIVLNSNVFDSLICVLILLIYTKIYSKDSLEIFVVFYTDCKISNYFAFYQTGIPHVQNTCG